MCDCVIFVGDSLNDGLMFGFFLNFCGVVNVCVFLVGSFNLLVFVVDVEGGEGFVEVVECIFQVYFGLEWWKVFYG